MLNCYTQENSFQNPRNIGKNDKRVKHKLKKTIMLDDRYVHRYTVKADRKTERVREREWVREIQL